jgi:hypothetical protein
VSIRDEDYADWLDEAEGEDGEGYLLGEEPSPGEILRGALREDLADAEPEALDEAVGQMLDAMSAAEGFNFAQALQQIGNTATKALSDPTINSILRTAVPLAMGAAGTVFGGPLGTAVGSGLGNALVGALPPVAGGRPGPPATPGAPPPPAPGAPPTPGAAAGTALASQLAGGSAAAAQGLMLTQQPEVLKALLSLAVGQAGRPAVNGVPVPQIMNLLSDVFGRAAAHADELMYTAPEQYGEAADEVGAPNPHALYTALMDANAMELAEAIEESAL